MKILAIEPLGEKGHINSNGVFLRALRDIGDVTLATFAGYQGNFDCDKRVAIPDRFHGGDLKVGRRINGIRALRYVQRSTDLSRFDIVFFLCYEEVSLAATWPARPRTYVFEHNNLDAISRSRVKRFCYRRLSRQVVHIAYMRYIADHIQTEYGAQAYEISHPYYRSCNGDSGAEAGHVPSGGTDRPTTIFSPSGSTDADLLNRLTHFVSQRDQYYLVAKAPHEQQGKCYRLRRFFDQYAREMEQCDLVFFGGRYSYRVSGIVFEAISFGKPAVVLDCRFARELQKTYPSSVITIRDIAEMDGIRPDHEGIRREQELFLQRHSYDRIKNELANVLAN